LAPVVVAVEAAEVGPRAATTGVSETVATTVTTGMAVAGSTAGEAMAVVAATVVVEGAISRNTIPDRSALK